MPVCTRETPNGKGWGEMTTKPRNRHEGRNSARWGVLAVFGHHRSDPPPCGRLAGGKTAVAPAFFGNGTGVRSDA
jgi:hypothetical protein